MLTVLRSHINLGRCTTEAGTIVITILSFTNLRLVPIALIEGTHGLKFAPSLRHVVLVGFPKPLLLYCTKTAAGNTGIVTRGRAE